MGGGEGDGAGGGAVSGTMKTLAASAGSVGRASDLEVEIRGSPRADPIQLSLSGARSADGDHTAQTEEN